MDGWTGGRSADGCPRPRRPGELEIKMNSMKILWLINRNNPNDNNLENLVELKFLAIKLIDSRKHSRYLNRNELYKEGKCRLNTNLLGL